MKERWIAPCFQVPDGASCDGRLEPAGAQLHTESYQAERTNQTETTKPHDCLERMIVGLRFGNRTHGNDRNGSHPQPPNVSPEMHRVWRLWSLNVYVGLAGLFDQ